MITLALIGIGKWGKNYLSTSKAFPNCRIKYICSLTPNSLDQIKGDFIKTKNYKDLFEYSDIDGVIIATPGSTHFQIAKEFIEKGFNLLIEKPVATSYRQALELRSLRNKHNVEILVGHTYLFDPAFLKLKELIKQIGAVRYASYDAVNNGPFRSDISILWDLGPHAISLLLEIYEQNPIRIKAWAHNFLRPETKIYDVVNLEMEFPNKPTALVQLNWLSPTKRRELIVVGSISTLVYDDLQPNRLTLFEDIGPKVRGHDILKRTPKIKYPLYEQRLPLEVELGEFIDALSKKHVITRSDLDFSIKITQLLNLAEDSIRDGGEVVDVKF